MPVQEGESGLALLLLFELDHGLQFPGMSGDNLPPIWPVYRRLKDRLAKDEELREWLTCKYMQMPMAPGLPASHHSRWSVKVVAPPEGTAAGWYSSFLEGWRGNLKQLSGQ